MGVENIADPCGCCGSTCSYCICTAMKSYSKVRISFTLTNMNVISRTALLGNVSSPDFCTVCYPGTSGTVGGLRVDTLPAAGGTCTGSPSLFFKHDPVTNTFPGLMAPSLTLNYDINVTITRDTENNCDILAYNMSNSYTDIDVTAPYIQGDCAATEYAVCRADTHVIQLGTVPDAVVTTPMMCCKQFTTRTIPYQYKFGASITPCATPRGTVSFSLRPLTGIENYTTYGLDFSGFPTIRRCDSEELLQYYEYPNDANTGNGTNSTIGNGNDVVTTLTYVCGDGGEWYATFDGTNADGVRLQGTIIPIP